MTDLFVKHGGFRKLHSFTLATIVQVETLRFCRRGRQLCRGIFRDGVAKNGGGRRIRTFEGIIQQIYSLPRLATSVSRLSGKSFVQEI